VVRSAGAKKSIQAQALTRQVADRAHVPPTYCCALAIPRTFSLTSPALRMNHRAIRSTGILSTIAISSSCSSVADQGLSWFHMVGDVGMPALPY
jgi:hypothetical protein